MPPSAFSDNADGTRHTSPTDVALGDNAGTSVAKTLGKPQFVLWPWPIGKFLLANWNNPPDSAGLNYAGAAFIALAGDERAQFFTEM